MKRPALALLLLLIAFALRAQTPATLPPSIDSRVEKLLARMTLEEKLGQLIQYTASEPALKEHAARGSVGCAFNFGAPVVDKNELQRIAVEKSRLGIPILIAHDVIHGFRTIFPVPLGIAATFDPSMAELTARISAVESRAHGIHWTFSPMVDIARDPRWGRIVEGSGEDPVLGAAMAAAFVRGYQGTDVSAPDAVLACAKHFAAYGAAEAGRDYNSVDMSERTLRQTYLPPFRAAIDAGVWTIMTAFNTLNNVPATASPYLLDQILRREWKFRGLVDSDYEAVEQLIPHGIAATEEEAAIKAITAGVDMNMVDATYSQLAVAVKNGRLAQSKVDDAVRRVLRMKFALGLFERPYTEEKRADAVSLTPEHRQAARRVAQRAIVLLKNDGGLLPLRKDLQSIALIGPLADDPGELLGSWAGAGKAEETVSVLAGVRAKLRPETRIEHVKGTDLTGEGTDGIAAAVEAAKHAEVVVMVVGEPGKMTGEANSRVSLDLPGRQQQLVEAVGAAGKPVVLVVMSGRPLTINWAAERIPAIVWPWYGGTEAGNALADVLFGDVSPGGKLPVTFPRSVGQIPIYHAALRTGRPDDPKDRYTSKYLDSPNAPLWPFGFGLSYGKIEYSDLRVNGTRVSATVKNAGTMAADEVVQFYLGDSVATIARPVKELKAFSRITLGAGESRRVEFEITRDMLAFWGEKGWVVEPGAFNVWIGGSSVDGLSGTYVHRP
jgi:beta-glucosidase